MHKKTSGFALLEVVVAIVILSSVLAGATSLIWSAANAVTSNQKRLTATYLAQECLEEARNVRDSAWRQHLPWDCAFIEACTDSDDPIAKMLAGEEAGDIKILETPTNFRRRMTVDDQGEVDSYEITCTVEWKLRGVDESLSLTEILTNWRKT